MEFADIEQLISILKDAKVTELSISTDKPQTTIKLRKPSSAVHPKPIRRKTGVAGKELATSNSQSTDIKPQLSDVQVTAPMVGIFHAIDCMASVDMPIKKGQILGSIESMKLMNDVISGYDGIVSEVLIEDGMPVEYGQGLFVLTVQE